MAQIKYVFFNDQMRYMAQHQNNTVKKKLKSKKNGNSSKIGFWTEIGLKWTKIHPMKVNHRTSAERSGADVKRRQNGKTALSRCRQSPGVTARDRGQSAEGGACEPPRVERQLLDREQRSDSKLWGTATAKRQAAGVIFCLSEARKQKAWQQRR